MAKDWMDQLFNGKEAGKQEQKEKRQQDSLRYSKLVALCKPIWDDIEKRLAKRIDAFNRRATPESKVHIISHTAEFFLELRCEKEKDPFVIRFYVAARTLSYGKELPSGQWTGGSLSFKIGADSHYTIEKPMTNEEISIEGIDKVILRDYLARLV